MLNIVNTAGGVYKFLYVYYLRKKNKLGNKLGLNIHCGSFDVGLMIYHIGTIVVNGDAIIGKNAIIHGNYCIGNRVMGRGYAPVIGDNVEFGFNSGVYGKINVPSGVKIGAGCVVVKDITESNTSWVGVPAKKVRI